MMLDEKVKRKREVEKINTTNKLTKKMMKKQIKLVGNLMMDFQELKKQKTKMMKKNFKEKSKSLKNVKELKEKPKN